MITDQELLEERGGNWASAVTAPLRFQQRIIEIRRAKLEKRPVPAPSRDYTVEAERRSAIATHAVRKSNVIPVVVLPLSSKVLADAYDLRKAREAAARALDQRVTDAFAAVRAGRNPFEEERYQSGQSEDPQQTMRCRGGSLSASVEDHEAACLSHREMAKRCKDMESGCRHHTAADAHRDAADHPATVDYQIRALTACAAAMAENKE
jgi:hypothetical protein